MNFRELTGVSIREAFVVFHKSNPAIYKVFEEQAIRATNKGRKKISAKLIINWIRWNAGRNCVWSQYLEIKSQLQERDRQIEELKNKNKK